MWACQNVGLPKLVHVKMRVSITCFIAKMWQHIFFLYEVSSNMDLAKKIWLAKFLVMNQLQSKFFRHALNLAGQRLEPNQSGSLCLV